MATVTQQELREPAYNSQACRIQPYFNSETQYGIICIHSKKEPNVLMVKNLGGPWPLSFKEALPLIYKPDVSFNKILFGSNKIIINNKRVFKVIAYSKIEFGEPIEIL